MTLKSPHIVQFKEHFSRFGELIIVTEQCEFGDLGMAFERMRSSGGGIFPEYVILACLTQALEAISKAHKFGRVNFKAKDYTLTKDDYTKLEQSLEG